MWLNNALWQDSEYAWSTFHRVLNRPPLLNMLRLRIWQCCEYARVTQGTVVELELFDKHFVKNTKKMPRRETFFPLDTLKTIFWMENLTQWWTQSGFFFPKSRLYFRFQKGHGRPPLSSLVARHYYYCNQCYYIRILVCLICTFRRSATILSFFNMS